MKKVYSQERFMKMPRPKRMRSLAFRVARGLFVAIAGAYLLLVGIIWYAQTKILFHPSPIVDVTPGDQGVKFDPVILQLGAINLRVGGFHPKTRRRKLCSTCTATPRTSPPMSIKCCAFEVPA